MTSPQILTLTEQDVYEWTLIPALETSAVMFRELLSQRDVNWPGRSFFEQRLQEAEKKIRQFRGGNGV